MLHGLCSVLTGVFMMLPAVRDLPAAGSVVIHLKTEAAVNSNTVRLKDVADLRGANPDQVRRLEQVILGPAPEFGSAVVMSRVQIQERVQAAVALDGAAVTGAAAVEIRLQGRPVHASDIAPLLKIYLPEKLSFKSHEIEVQSIGGLEGIELPEVVDFRISSAPTLAGRRSILFPIEAVKDGKVLRSFWVMAEIAIRAPVLTAAKKIPFEKVIAAEDLKETVADIPDLRACYARQPEEIMGKLSRRRFSPGDPLTLESFTAPVLVHHGETVQLRLERNGIVLTSLAKAEQDGKLGQTITVRNIDFSSVVKARVTGPAAVQIR